MEVEGGGPFSEGVVIRVSILRKSLVVGGWLRWHRAGVLHRAVVVELSPGWEG